MARPTKMTNEAVAKLESAFLLGCTDLEACCYANIDRSTLYRFQASNPEFSDRKPVLKSNPFMLARRVIIKALENGDVATAHKVLDRAEGSRVKVAYLR